MKNLPLRLPLPPGRTHEQLQNHYLVESALAARLKASSGAERKAIYETMYEELFRQVPDHPRLTRRVDPEQTRVAINDNLALLRPWLTPNTEFAEFAPGDCWSLAEVARYVRSAYGIDISDQRADNFDSPPNFHLAVYDGEHLDTISDASLDVVYSNQFIEHIHPDETIPHFKLVWRLLKPGGVYVFQTPHLFSGPHDVSQFFSDEPKGFHLKEWTYRELQAVLLAIGYRSLSAMPRFRGKRFPLGIEAVILLERFLALSPSRLRWSLSRRLLSMVTIVAIK